MIANERAAKEVERFITNRTTAEEATPKASSQQWVLRLAFLVVVVFLLNYALLLLQEGVLYWFTANVVTVSIFIFISSMMTEFTDRKLTYLSLKIYNWMARASLIVKEGDDEEERELN